VRISSNPAKPLNLLRVLLAAAVLFWAGTAVAQNARTNTATNLRAGPGTEFSVITTMQAGSLLRILGCTAGYLWCGVNFAGIEGFAAGRFLTIVSGQHSGQIVTGIGVGLALSIPLWRRDYWRPKYFYRPGHHPPGWRPPNRPTRPPAARPPRPQPPVARPPSGRPPGARPPGGRPPGARPPGGRPPVARPPGNRPPGMRPPSGGGQPGRRPSGGSGSVRR
jgi:uncharacterized protein YraI